MSVESLAMIKEKEQKKREEEEAKEARKREREEKKLQQKARKAELKAIERKRKAAEAAANREAKKAKLLESRAKKSTAEKKAKQGVSKIFITRSKSASGYVPQHDESSNNECTLCFGNYNDDLSDDGTLTREWLQCTNDSCGKWMHEDCPSKNEDGYSICPCGAVFM